MVGFATVIAIGIVIGSISVSMMIFWDSQTISKFSEYNDEIKVGNVKFDVQYVANYEFLEKDKAQQEFQEFYIETGHTLACLANQAKSLKEYISKFKLLLIILVMKLLN